jgi:glycosyltransferase involved in cell wall biosynthesis
VSAIVQVVTALERGGAQRVTLEAAAQLHRPARPSYLIAGPPPAALFDEARTRLGDRLIVQPALAPPLAPGRDLQALLGLSRQLARLAAQHGTLVVHTHSSKAGILGRLAARSVRAARTVHTVHGFGIGALGQRATPLLVAAEQIASAATDVLLLVSHADARRCDALRLSRRAARRVLPESCDGPRYAALPRDAEARAAARERLGLAEDVPLAVTVGNLKPQKDPLFHVDILEAWRAETPDAALLFLGDGPLREDTEARRRTLGLDDALHLPGFIADPADALVAADVMVLASRWEGLPLAVLEALAAGIPVVVRNPGWADDVTFAGDRFIALPVDAPAAAYADALEQLRRLPPRKVALPPLFTWEGALQALDDLYDQLLRP